MTVIDAPDALVSLNVPPELEGTVVDWLLEHTGGAGFTSFPVSGHSTSHKDLSIAEQVSGSQRRQMFQVKMRAGDVAGFLEDARENLGTADIRYWVLPVIRAGRLEDEGADLAGPGLERHGLREDLVAVVFHQARDAQTFTRDVHAGKELRERQRALRPGADIEVGQHTVDEIGLVRRVERDVVVSVAWRIAPA